jgi:hypothetical protein
MSAEHAAASPEQYGPILSKVQTIIVDEPISERNIPYLQAINPIVLTVQIPATATLYSTFPSFNRLKAIEFKGPMDFTFCEYISPELGRLLITTPVHIDTVEHSTCEKIFTIHGRSTQRDKNGFYSYVLTRN